MPTHTTIHPSSHHAHTRTQPKRSPIHPQPTTATIILSPSPSPLSSSASDDDVEDLCLVCDTKACHCGGAKGDNVREKSPELGLGMGPTLKLRFTMPAPTSVPNTKKTKKLSSASTSSTSTRTRSRPSASHTPPIPPPSATTTPSRMSLRQVLAASAKEAEEYNSSHSREGSGRDERERKDKGKKKEEFVEDEDLEMEEEEEEALRAEYERKQFLSASDGSESETESEISTTSDEDGEGEGKRKGNNDSLMGDDFFDFDNEATEDEEEGEGLTITDLPGVVTWSDYDNLSSTSSSSSSGEEEDEEEEGDSALMRKKAAREFENELEALLKLSEAVHGPVRKEEFEIGEMWFEEISTSDSDGESRDGDDESEGSDCEDGMKLLEEGISSDEGEGDSDDSEMFYEGPFEGAERSDLEEEGDGGDTTDSLDSDDHVGLVRFGIEVDSSSSDTSTSSRHPNLSQHPFGTASLADVQAPTSADLASLPQYLFVGRGFEKDDMGKGKRRQMEDISEGEEEEDENERRRRLKREAKKRKVAGPAMGVWAPAATKEKMKKAVVIDESETLAPSPFAKMKRRRGRHLLDGTPARRLRADSKVSTTSGPSVTDGSISGEVLEIPSPFLADADDADVLDFDLNDVLHASLLHSGADSSDEDQEVAIGLADLSRWNRVPIGSFRSSTVRSPQAASYLLTTSDSPAAAHLHPHHRHRSLSHTLSSPHASVRSTKRRMLSSPVFGPVPTPSGMNSPKSHRARRKEKKAGTTTTMMASPATNALAAPAQSTPFRTYRS